MAMWGSRHVRRLGAALFVATTLLFLILVWATLRPNKALMHLCGQLQYTYPDTDFGCSNPRLSDDSAA